MGRGVDEVAERDESSRETDGRTVEGGYEYFGVCVESIGDLEIIGYETLECLATDVSGSWERFGNGDIGSTVIMILNWFHGIKNPRSYAEK